MTFDPPFCEEGPTCSSHDTWIDLATRKCDGIVTLLRSRASGCVKVAVVDAKLDGIRVLAFKNGSDVRLLSRNKLPLNDAYPAVVEAIAALPVTDVILDGEATGAWGRQGRFTYHVFDILWLDGRDVTALTLDARRDLLARLPLRSPVGRVDALAVIFRAQPRRNDLFQRVALNELRHVLSRLEQATE